MAAGDTTPCAAIQASALSTSARLVGGERIVFNLGGNKFRLIARIVYASKAHDLGGILFVRFIGTHEEYDAVDAATV